MNTEVFPRPTSDSIQHLWELLARAPSLALLIDLDGTVIPFASTVEQAVLDESGARLLRRLGTAGAQVVVVSGRPKASIDVLRPLVPEAWWVAEHGAWRSGDGHWQAPPLSTDLRDIEQRLRALAGGVPGARVEHKTLSVCLHWRLVPEPACAALVTAAELAVEEWLETHPDHERLDGAMVLEVRHRAANKGAAVRWTRGRMRDDTRIVALGDDITDEDTFAALDAEDAAVGVGDVAGRRGRAAWWLRTTADARRLLAWIAETRAVPGVPSRVPVYALGAPRRLQPRTSPLLVVSNRTPAAVGTRHKEVGGLVSALKPTVARTGGVWLGWSGHERDPGLELTLDDDGPSTRALFDYPTGWRHHFYDGFCNQSLWPLLHCFPGRVRYHDDEWTAYLTANEAYARLAARLVDPDGTVWIHDYQLMMVGTALRHLGHRGPIGFFLHVPFPPRDVWETLPWSAEILGAMHAYDLIGFHTSRWAENFLSAATATRQPTAQGGTVLIKGARRTTVDVFPIGIDSSSFAAPAGEPSPDIEALRAALGDRKLLLGVDRLDYSKGIPERLEGFRRLLQLHAHWRGRVSFVQISVPSRADVPEYAELRRRVEELVGRINGELGEADWVPVRYLYRSYEPPILAQLYRLADVGVVTPLRDGMNLVAKEFVAAQDPAHPGVLVLSRFAGAAEDLDDAILTNPYHPDGLAADLDRALAMPADERRRRHAALLAATTRTSATQWADRFLERLITVHR